MAKVLVTGASGFIGTHLVAALAARGDDVTCLVRKQSQVGRLQALGAKMVLGDVTDSASLPPAVAGKQIIYHLAGRVCALNRRQFLDVNRRGAACVAKACAKQQTTPVLVHVSSLAAAGPAIDGRARVESDPPAPVSCYGRSKRSGEHAVERFAARLPITIVRPAIVLGEGDVASLPMFRSIVRFRLHAAPGLRSTRVSLLHVDDLVQLFILAAERGKRLTPPSGKGQSPGTGYYFAANEQDVLYADLGRLIAESVGQRVVVIPVRRPLIRTITALGEIIGQIRGKPSLMNLDKFREIMAGSWICSSQAARDDLGFTVTVPLIERLRQTAQWYRREGWL